MRAAEQIGSRTVYSIRDAEGRLKTRHIRVDSADGNKCMWWELPDGSKGLNGTPLEDLPLYGAERVHDWDEDALIVVVEGEKARDALVRAELKALGTVTGASGTPGQEALEVLRGRRVCLWPDGDDAGRGHMERVAEGLGDVAAEVLIYTWHDAPDDVKGPDAADHPAVLSKDPKATDRLLTDLEDAPRWNPADVSGHLELHGHSPGVTVSQAPNRGVTPVTLLRFAEMPPPGPREYLVEDLVPKKHTTTIYGDGGSAKSILALSLATAVAGGAERWMGRQVQNCPVLYGDFELDSDEQRRRAYQVARGVYLDKPPYDLLYVSGLGRPPREVLIGCLEECVREGVGLFIIDSLGITLEGDAGDAHDVIGFHHKYLDPFRAAGVTLVVIDHQGKAQAAERYQHKRTFGSVYKENLARSVLQVEPSDPGKGLMMVKLRQSKHNFGPKAEPFGAKLRFSEEKITVSEHSLDATELAQEHTLNAGHRVMLVLKDGPAYPTDISEKSEMPHGTVKNELTRLRKRGLVEYTGEVEPQTKAKEVRLTKDGLSVTGVTDPIESCDAVTPDHEDCRTSVYVNEQGEVEF
jgi:DNA-binding transcriptional ArsR family regulator